MPTLTDYRQFSGTHPETGTIHNALAYQGVISPATGQPFSEAMLFGLSGGIGVMYFVFEYKGHDPQLFIGTRNTFDPVATLLARLQVKAQRQTTTNAQTAVTHLTKALARGKPALVLADQAHLAYNAQAPRAYPTMLPLLVYGYDETANLVQIADRAPIGLTSTPAELAGARAAHAPTNHQLSTLTPPSNFDHLPAAVEESLRACAALFLDPPPKGPAENFGLAALQKWANLLVDDKDKRGWPKLFPRGPLFYLALTSAFEHIALGGTFTTLNPGAARPLYADFIDEAANLLNRPALREAANQFRSSGRLWDALATDLLPDADPSLQAVRQWRLQRHQLFIQQGNASVDERHTIDQKLAVLKESITQAFPMSDGETVELRAKLRDQLLRLHNQEQTAALHLRELC